MRNVKNDIKKRARMTVGLLNLLTDDVYNLRADADDFDLICLEESVRDAKTTLQMFTDNVTEIEYMLYLIKNNDAC